MAGWKASATCAWWKNCIASWSSKIPSQISSDTATACGRFSKFFRRLRKATAPFSSPVPAAPARNSSRAIHNLSRRRTKRFVAINCGALPDNLLESELFGYKAGAFTDARRDKPGRFALAEGGTVFLDEIGDISAAMQTRLLRVLQERVYEPLGSIETIKADVRIIAATNKNLRNLVEQGKFRKDLFYCIHVVPVDLPTLRDRREDIPLLIEHFIARFNRLKGKDIAGVSDSHRYGSSTGTG